MTALLRMDVRCDREAPAAVRQSIRHLDELGWVAGDAIFVASELVSNAVLHGGCDEDDLIEVTVDESPGSIVVSVRDGGPCEAAPRGTTATDSLGLQLVAALSRRFGSSRKNGYEVWAELAR